MLINGSLDAYTRSLVDVVSDYSFALDTLDDYDHQRLALPKTQKPERFKATYENAMAATLFLWFMQNNGILYNRDGSKRIADAKRFAD